MEIREARELSLERELASLEKLFQLVRDYCTRADLGPDLVYRAELVAEELFTNLVKYNSEGRRPIEFTVGRSARHTDGLALRFVDRGVHAFDPSQAPKTDTSAPLEQRRPGGLGLQLVQRMVDSLDYHHEAGDSTTTVVLLPRSTEDEKS